MANKYAHFSNKEAKRDRFRRSPKTCKAKVRYKSQTKADESADNQKKKKGRELKPYYCGMCKGYHLTKSKTPNP